MLACLSLPVLMASLATSIANAGLPVLADAFDADFYLMTTELTNLLPAVFDILGGEVQSAKS